MQTLGEMSSHVMLVRRMAQVTQTDLAAAAEAGDLAPSDWADMVQSCRRCGWAGDCATWLAATSCAETAPAECCNRMRFAALRVSALLEEGAV